MTGKQFYFTRFYDSISIDCNYGIEVRYKRILITGDIFKKKIDLVSCFYNFGAKWTDSEETLLIQELSSLGIRKYDKKEHIHILVEDFRTDLEKLEEKAKYITDLLQNQDK